MKMQPVKEMKYIPDLIAIQAEHTPDATALTYGKKQITYFELNRQSNQLAWRLRRLGVGLDVRVAVSLEPSVEAVVGLLGVLKSGGAYLPLDPGFPSEWRKSILAASSASVLLTEGRLRHLFDTFSNESIRLESDWETLARESDEEPPAVWSPGSLAGVLYSASRVARQIEHHSLSARLFLLREKLQFSSEDVFLDQCISAFCDSELYMLLPLVFGGRLALSPSNDESMNHLPSVVASESATVMRLTPSGLSRFLNSLGEQACNLSSLRRVLCSGEPLSRDLVDRFFSILPDCELHYCYAPPEAGREVAWQVCTAGQTRDFAPIGRPVRDVSVRILDKRGKLAPIGLAGEIFVAGYGLSRKAEDNSRVSPSALLRSGSIQTEIETLRGTGDMGRWLSDGTLELLKTNRDVWFGGTRVQLNQIGQSLMRHPAVLDCAVLTRETTDHSYELVAYVVLSEPHPGDHLRAHLEGHLPSSLVPRFFVPVAHLPLTATGQVDEETLASLEVIDDSMVDRWTQQLRSIPEIEEVAVVVGEHFEIPAPLDLSELLPREERRPSRPTSASVMRTIEESEDARPAISIGEAITAELPATLRHVLEDAARVAPQQGVVYLQADNSERFQSYSSLLEEAECIASGLRHLGLGPGEKVILQFQDNRDFLTGFWGCVLSGSIPVPISIAPTYKEMNSILHKLRNAWEMLGHPIILTSSGLQSSVAGVAEMLDLDGLRVETVDELRLCGNDGLHHRAEADDTALILLTSGSTGMPKGVVLRHRNVINRCYATSKMNEFSSEDVSLNWLPMDHVGGIVMFHIRDVFLRCRQVHAPTSAFLEHPLNWLDWIDRYRATVTWAPNFAYALINVQSEKVREGRWDLSSMRFILNAGEAIVPETASRFLEILAPHGLPDTAMHPAWGMSETSSAVTYSDEFRVERGADSSPFVEVGKPIPGISIRIVNNQGELLNEGQIGRLQIRGNTVTGGYYQNPNLNQEAFSDDGWFITGDLGFIRDGALTITGREKDVIIINGINYYSHEIEGVVDELSGLASSYTAACAIRDPGSQTDKLAIFFNPLNDDPATVAELCNEIRERVVGDIGINPSYLIPTPKEAIPKTEIGKIQRSKLRERFEAGEFDAILHQVDIQTGKADTIPDWFYESKWVPREPSPFADDLTGKHYLIFVNQSELGKALTRALKSNGATFTRVERGSAFEKTGPGEYKVDPHKREHYERVFASLADERMAVSGVIHLWPSDKPASEINTINALREAQRVGIYSLIFATQALAKISDPQQPVSFYVVTCRAQPVDADDPVAWENGAIRGFVRTIGQEMSWIRCLSIDLEGANADRSAENIVCELKGTHTESEVAFRRSKRLIHRLSKVDMLGSNGKGLPIQEEGIYLITGGLGGIGTELARFLIERYDAKLILLGRTPLEKAGDEWKKAARLANYDSLKSATDEIIYRAADVCDVDALQGVVAGAERRWGKPLAGVFHLAGEGNLLAHWAVFDQHSVLNETVENFEAMFQSKVYGALALSQMLSARPDAFLVTFSSINGIMGGANFSAYSAANSFLEAFSTHINRTRDGKTCCFSWTIWDDIGMSEGNPDYAMNMVRSHGYHVISKKQGFNSLLAGLSRGHEHLIVGLDGANRDVRRYTLQKTLKTKNHTAYFTTREKELPPATFKDLSVRDRFGAATSCRFVQVADIPLDSDGRVDVHALVAQNQALSATQQSAIAPRTETEKILASIWQEILQRDKVGVHDNFFELGGHSLLAMQVISRIRDAFQVELPLRALFESSTVADMADRVQIEEHSAEGVQLQLQPIRRADRRGPLALSYAQQRLWFLAQLNPDSAFYNIPAAVQLNGKLNVEALKRAIDEVISRHEVLRTVFISEKGLPRQVIKEHEPVMLKMDDISRMSEEGKRAELQKRMREEADKPFDLKAGPLLSVGLLKLDPAQHILMFTVHHIVTDGWSTAVMIKEVGALYEAYSQGRDSPLDELQLQYVDYAVWQKQWLATEVLRTQMGYWKKQLAGAAVLGLPTDKPRPAMQSFKGSREYMRFGEEVTRKLRELSRRESVTMHMVLLAGFQILLQRYSGQDEIVVGSPIGGRNRAELEPLIGFFVNTLVLRTELSGDPTVRELLGRVKEVCLGAYSHQDLPFEQLVDELQPERDLSRNPLFQVMFVLQDNTQQSTQFLRDLTISSVPLENTTAKFDLTLLMEEGESYLSGALEYCSDLFHQETIRKMFEQLAGLLEAMAANPDQRISDLPLLSESELYQIVSAWNDTAAVYPKNMCFHQVFEEQVEKTPNAVAVSFGQEQLTYRELNARANQLAHYLRSLGVGPETFVGILMERSIEMLVGMLGVFKAGGAYVPMDLNLPKDRLRFILDETNVRVVLTGGESEEWIGEHGPVLVRLDESWQDAVAGQRTHNPVVPVAPENACYVIYTSGSTGVPKGVVIQHKSLVNYLYWCTKAYNVADGQGSAVHSPIGFDLTITSLFAPLLAGRPVRLLTEDQSVVALSEALLENNHYSLVKITPTHLEVINQQIGGRELRGATMALVIGGEALYAETLKVWIEHAGQTRIINEYGPTETVVGCCIYEVDAEEELSGPVPIGRPIANTQLYILDRKMRVVPVGAKGEIYIGGEGLARGYLNKPAATAEVFVPDPFSGRAGARLYRTGDFGKYRSDGNIEFLGRIDHQVKVRGYRIEPGEIESVLEQHQGIKEAVVLARGEKDKRLVAYLVSSNGERVPVSELREYLRQRLPDYMVASGYVWMEEMPVTANGKLDRAALPEPDDEAVGRETDYVPPTGEVERALAEIWSKVIGVQRVGIYDSFFELGGDSLKLTQVQALIKDELNYELSLAEMFQYPTVQLLAQLISAGEKATFVEEDNRHLDTLMHGKQNLLQQRRQRTEKKSES